jgi:hypothetical protein
MQKNRKEQRKITKNKNRNIEKKKPNTKTKTANNNFFNINKKLTKKIDKSPIEETLADKSIRWELSSAKINEAAQVLTSAMSDDARFLALGHEKKVNNDKSKIGYIKKK